MLLIDPDVGEGPRALEQKLCQLMLGPSLANSPFLQGSRGEVSTAEWVVNSDCMGNFQQRRSTTCGHLVGSVAALRAELFCLQSFVLVLIPSLEAPRRHACPPWRLHSHLGGRGARRRLLILALPVHLTRATVRTLLSVRVSPVSNGRSCLAPSSAVRSSFYVVFRLACVLPRFRGQHAGWTWRCRSHRTEVFLSGRDSQHKRANALRAVQWPAVGCQAAKEWKIWG